MNSTDGPESALARKLDHLFTNVVPAGRLPYSSEEVARAITADGTPISGSYIWLLRKGQRDNPTLRHLEGLAKFFGVPPAYFFDDQVARAVDTDLQLLTALRDAHVQKVALRTAGLSVKSLKSIAEVIERVRELEGLSEEQFSNDV
ncbi:helix-turn-helix domain-containing protein [Streptomyces fulvorobeus]|uniref:Transcriptional regulator with XRE-family HTH domain n=1 Tax=Streptomyces fulvorobeus TaxID=284028 RepID=A0A7J0C5A2_9ACTN|nr:helix-turn-helix domain-containing protein [Streptomyces fulvorobeus]NYE41345.1 transcriptional regulator with XRE-family HTH domain [Streptomyces fulvorobeus]GFM97692.1 XRE family transcriptional regulator [Streptomyces fulvorobeus]